MWNFTKKFNGLFYGNHGLGQFSYFEVITLTVGYITAIFLAQALNEIFEIGEIRTVLYFNICWIWFQIRDIAEIVQLVWTLKPPTIQPFLFLPFGNTGFTVKYATNNLLRDLFSSGGVLVGCRIEPSPCQRLTCKTRIHAFPGLRKMKMVAMTR